MLHKRVVEKWLELCSQYQTWLFITVLLFSMSLRKVSQHKTAISQKCMNIFAPNFLTCLAQVRCFTLHLLNLHLQTQILQPNKCRFY